jgi:hypothetical protein
MAKRLFQTLLLLMIMGLWTSLLQAQEATTERAISIEEKQQPEKQPTALEQIKNTKPGFKVALWTNRKNDTYKLGEEVVFYFKSNRSARLTLFNVGTSGKTHILFPNAYQKDNLVKAGKVYQFPAKQAKYFFKAEGPPGNDVVKAVATLGKVPLVKETDLKPEGEVQRVDKPQSELARDVSIALRPLKSKQWSEAVRILHVRE